MVRMGQGSGGAGVGLCLVLLCFVFGGALAGGERADEGEVAQGIIVAAMPFWCASGDVQYEPLAQSMGDMIAAYLGSAEGLVLVERAELDKVLREQALTLEGLVEEATKAQVGRLLGAKYLLTGSVTVVERQLRIDAHFLEVETTRVASSETAEGQIGELVGVVKMVAEKLAADLDLELPEVREEQIEQSPQAGLHFLRGLGYYYANMLDQAIGEFMRTLTLDVQNSRARYWTAQCYFDLGEWEHAEIEYQRFEKDFPEDPLASVVAQRLKECEAKIGEQVESE